MQAVPVPDAEVPLAEILEFKIKRRDELEVLWDAISGFVDRVEGATDKKAELQCCVSTIDQACRDAIAVSKEWLYPVRLSNWKVQWDIRPFQPLAMGLLAMAGAHVYGLNAVATGLGSAALSAAPFLKLRQIMVGEDCVGNTDRFVTFHDPIAT